MNPNAISFRICSDDLVASLGSPGDALEPSEDCCLHRPVRGSHTGREHEHVLGLRDWKCGFAAPNEVGDGDHGEKRPPGKNWCIGRPHQWKAGAVDFVPH